MAFGQTTLRNGIASFRHFPGARRARQLRRQVRRGATLVVILTLIVAIIIASAFSLELAYMQLVQTQLRAATDAAARAGGEALSRTQDVTSSRLAAIEAASRNEVAGSPLRLRDGDIVFGHSSQQGDGSWSFVPGQTPTNALRVRGSRTNDSLSGNVPLFFGHFMGKGYFEPEKDSTVVHLDRDICLVVDRSGSMAWDLSGEDWSFPPGIPPMPDAYCTPPHPTLSRWGALDAAVDGFNAAVAETLQDEQLALVSYSTAGSWCSGTTNRADINQPLTANYNLITSAMDHISSKPIPGGTSISSGIDLGVQVLTDTSRTRAHAFKTMVLLTDGHHNDGRDPLLAAYDAAEHDITIHTVTFSTGADEAKMREVAEATGGKHYHAPGAEELQAIFREIALTLPVVFVD